MKRVAAILTVVVCALAGARAQISTPIALAGTAVPVSTGPGEQTDPHVSGSRVSYTVRIGTSSTVHVFDFATGIDKAIGGDGQDPNELMSDVSGDVVVFVRRHPVSETDDIAFVNLQDPTLAVGVLTVSGDGYRLATPSIGADTVAYVQSIPFGFGSSRICVASLSHVSDPPHCLTTADFTIRAPDVSPDGNTVVFQQCPTQASTECDIYAARRDALGSWGTPVAIASGGHNASPKTNGSLVVYSSDAAVVGHFEVYYAPADGTGTPTRLQLFDIAASVERVAAISGTLVTIEQFVNGETNRDLFVFDLATNAFARLPSTPTLNEHLADVFVAPDGSARLVWAVRDPLALENGDDVYSFSFALNRPSYSVCALFDASKSFKAGRVVPLKLALCDANGHNLSRADLVLTATDLVHQDATASTVLAPDSPGEANADGVFRYDATLGGYVFNLSTTGLTTGTWELQFRVSGEAAVYGIRFDVK